MTTGQLAAALGLRLYGDEGLPLSGVAAVADASVEQLAFIGGAKFFAAGLESKAGCVIAPAEYAARAGQTVLVSGNPRADFAYAVNLLHPPIASEPGIHPTAIVDRSARVHPTARLGPHCVVEANAEIGEGSILHSRVTVYPRVKIGARCVIHSGAVLGADGFGFEMFAGAYRKVPQVGSVEIGDDVEIGANTCVDRAALGTTTIGSGTKLDNLVHIGHNCRIGRHVVIAAQTGLAGGVEIGDYAIVGGQVGVGDKARIEAKAIIGSGAGILTSKIVRAGEPVWGTPARPLRQYLSQLATVARLAKKRV